MSGWGDLLDQLSVGGNFYRLKEGTTKLRLVQLPTMKAKKGQPFVFYGEVQTSYRGNERTRFVIPALVLEGKGARPEMSKKVTPVVITKTILKGILGLLAEGYELFDLKEGYGIAIKRTGTGLNTDYAVLPSRNPQPMPEDFELPGEKVTIDEMASEFETWANRPASRARAGESETEDDF